MKFEVEKFAVDGVGVRFKNFFGTYLHRLTTFILEVWLYLADFQLKSTIPVGRLAGEAEIRTSTAQLKLELGLSLTIGLYSHMTRRAKV